MRGRVYRMIVGVMAILAFAPICSDSCTWGGERAGSAGADDDSWRRTASGWERIDEWHLASAAPQASYWQAPSHMPTGERRPPSLTLHPISLAALQIGVVLIAFAAFPWIPAMARKSLL